MNSLDLRLPAWLETSYTNAPRNITLINDESFGLPPEVHSRWDGTNQNGAKYPESSPSRTVNWKATGLQHWKLLNISGQAPPTFPSGWAESASRAPAAIGRLKQTIGSQQNGIIIGWQLVGRARRRRGHTPYPSVYMPAGAWSRAQTPLKTYPAVDANTKTFSYFFNGPRRHVDIFFFPSLYFAWRD